LSYHHDFKSSGSSLILLASLITILVLYVVTLPLYVHIFIFVKKSSNHMGVKRELRLARKIALLVFTNFVFFAFPILLILMLSIFAKFHSDPFDFDGDAFKSTMFKITIGQWLPVTCLSINSMLDPFLYAFRHTQFKREIRRKKTRSSNKVFPFLSVSPPVNTTTGDSMAFNSCPLAGRKNIEVGAPRSKTNNQEETSCVNDQTSGWSWVQCHSKQHLHKVLCILLSMYVNQATASGGRVAEVWHWTRNLLMPSSSPALTANWIYYR